MFKFIKQVFIALLSFSASIARIASVPDCAKYISLNNEPCLARPILINLNSNELQYHPLTASLVR